MSALPDEIVSFRRYLKRRNYAVNTQRSYLNDLAHFLRLVDKPVREVSAQDVERFIEQQQEQGLAASTINRRLVAVARLYTYLRQAEDPELVVPVRPQLHYLKQPDPLPRGLKSEEVQRLFAVIDDPRDRAIFSLMLRCGLRVREVTRLEIQDVDLAGQQLLIRQSKNQCDRLVYVALDALQNLEAYLTRRGRAECAKLFLVPGGRGRGQGISVRGIQKRLEHYAAQAGLEDVTCHRLRHTFAGQLLDNGAEITTVQALLGHRQVTTTQRYTRVSNPKVRDDYFRGMAQVLDSSS